MSFTLRDLAASAHLGVETSTSSTYDVEQLGLSGYEMSKDTAYPRRHRMERPLTLVLNRVG
jgi:hypothetical protein